MAHGKVGVKDKLTVKTISKFNLAHRRMISKLLGFQFML